MAGPCCTLSSPLLNNDPPPIGGRGFCSVLHIAMQRSKRRGKVAVDMIASWDGGTIWSNEMWFLAEMIRMTSR
jgi:hypothetical protein